MRLFQDCVRLLITLPMPTVALVQGASPAGGCVLSLCCDRRIGVKDGFSMGLTEVMVGMAPPIWVHTLGSNHLGHRNAAYAIQRGLMFNSEDSLRLGFVDKLVPADSLLKSGLDELNQYAKLPWESRKDAKLKSVNNVVVDLNDEALKGVVDSISGKEFQTVVKGILKSLNQKK